MFQDPINSFASNFHANKHFKDLILYNPNYVDDAINIVTVSDHNVLQNYLNFQNIANFSFVPP